MAKTASDSIEKLRKKSQTLLARVDEDSKRVNLEIKKLRLQTSTLTNYQNEESQDDHIARNTYLWKLRNDSSGISAILCPDYFHASPKLSSASVSDMISSKKLTLTSRKGYEHCSRIPPRKPVKGCYCYSEVSRTPLRLSNSQHKPASYCRQCKSQLEFKPTKETEEKVVLSSPISCETFRRVRKIDYTPRSQFLRNVQHKICELQSGGEGDCLRTCPRSPSYKFMANTRIPDDIPDEKTTLSTEYNSADKRQKPSSSLEAPANSIASDQSESDRGNRAHTTSRETSASSQKQSKSTLQKIIGSRRERLESNLGPMLKSPTRNKRTMQLNNPNCYCCYRNELGDKHERKRNLSKYHEQTCQYLKLDDSPVINNSTDQMKDLRTFREKNYFETHGSSHTLTSSRSSGSLQQYLLNERLFPEPVRRIHMKDLVVTMPPCATMQKKRIHYFPRHVVYQEKNVCNTNYRRKRRQNCPLTGHAIDLGVLKAKLPLNSLALKYQKSALC